MDFETVTKDNYVVLDPTHEENEARIVTRNGASARTDLLEEARGAMAEGLTTSIDDNFRRVSAARAREKHAASQVRVAALPAESVARQVLEMRAGGASARDEFLRANERISGQGALFSEASPAFRDALLESLADMSRIVASEPTDQEVLAAPPIGAPAPRQLTREYIERMMRMPTPGCAWDQPCQFGAHCQGRTLMQQLLTAQGLPDTARARPGPLRCYMHPEVFEALSNTAVEAPRARSGEGALRRCIVCCTFADEIAAGQMQRLSLGQLYCVALGEDGFADDMCRQCPGRSGIWTPLYTTSTLHVAMDEHQRPRLCFNRPNF